MLVGEVERMTRITVRRVLNIAAIAVVIALVFSLLGWGDDAAVEHSAL